MSARPRRVLHVVGGLGPGGVETWLMHILRRNDRARCEMDVLVHTEEPRVYDAEAAALGVRLLRCPYPRRPVRYARHLRRLLREHGPYDVIHSHVHHFSGLILREAAGAGVPTRIVHSHNDCREAEAAAGFVRRAYLALMKRWIRQYATLGLACAGDAGAALFDRSWGRDARWSTHYLGIDLAPFRVPVEGLALRRELGIPDGALVVGHVGRFFEQKNHAFLVRVAHELAARRRDCRLLLVGDGPLRPRVEQEVAALGLSDRTIFAGVRRDIPALMRAVMDVFLLPSLHEGLPLVLMETQAAGLPALVSSCVTPEADVIPALVQREALSKPPERWAERVLELAETGDRPAPFEALARMAQSPFCVEVGWARLQRLYGVDQGRADGLGAYA